MSNFVRFPPLAGPVQRATSTSPAGCDGTRQQPSPTSLLPLHAVPVGGAARVWRGAQISGISGTNQRQRPATKTAQRGDFCADSDLPPTRLRESSRLQLTLKETGNQNTHTCLQAAGYVMISHSQQPNPAAGFSNFITTRHMGLPYILHEWDDSGIWADQRSPSAAAGCHNPAPILPINPSHRSSFAS